MAKVDLKNLEAVDRLRRAIGVAITRARGIAGITQDELAGSVARALRRERFDPAQIARWEAGKERPQFDVLFAVDEMRWPLIQCIAQLDEAVEVVTHIRRRDEDQPPTTTRS